MKKALFTLCWLVAVSQLNAQGARDVFKGQSIVWFGLDFSKANLSGVPDEKPDVIKNEYLEGWNQPMLYERDRFPLAGVFHKPTVHYDVGVVSARNKNVTTSDLFKKDAPIITTATIEKVISEYPVGQEKEGLGVVFLIESFNKKKNEAVAHVVFFDIATHTVLLTKRLVAEPGGGGLKNYWANAIGRMMDQITRTLWTLWEKEANSSK